MYFTSTSKSTSPSHPKPTHPIPSHHTSNPPNQVTQENPPTTPPSRQLPARKARTPIGRFKEESSEGEGEGYETAEQDQEEQGFKTEIESAGEFEGEGESEGVWE